MPIDLIYDEIPDNFEPKWVQRDDGRYELDFEKEQVEEHSSTQSLVHTLQKTNKLNRKLAGEVKQLSDYHNQNAEQDRKRANKADETVAHIQKEYEAKIQELNQKLEQQVEATERERFLLRLRKSVQKLGIKLQDGADEIIEDMALKHFKKDKDFGDWVARNADGSVRFKKGGERPERIEDWVENLPSQTKTQFLFESISGNNATGSRYAGSMSSGRDLVGLTGREKLEISVGEYLQSMR